MNLIFCVVISKTFDQFRCCFHLILFRWCSIFYSAFHTFSDFSLDLLHNFLADLVLLLFFLILPGCGSEQGPALLLVLSSPLQNTFRLVEAYDKLGIIFVFLLRKTGHWKTNKNSWVVSCSKSSNLSCGNLFAAQEITWALGFYNSLQAMKPRNCNSCK